MTKLNVQILSHPAITSQSWDDVFFRLILNTTTKQKLHTVLSKMTFHPLDSNQRLAEHDQCSLKALE